jgi:molybdopterin-guanine dinucleotide biosynthesis protein A
MQPSSLAADTARCPDVTGVILAGGRSSRMGRDKASLIVSGVPLFEGVLTVLQRVFAEVLIAGDRPDLCRPQVPCLTDLYPGSALGGLYTALLAARTPFIFAAACDLPYPDPRLIRAILARREGYDVVVPCTPRGLEPLFALYGKGCLAPMREQLEAGRLRICELFARLRVRHVEAAELPPGWERALCNLNTPEDLRRLTEEEPRQDAPGAGDGCGRGRKKRC